METNAKRPNKITAVKPKRISSLTGKKINLKRVKRYRINYTMPNINRGSWWSHMIAGNVQLLRVIGNACVLTGLEQLLRNKALTGFRHRASATNIRKNLKSGGTICLSRSLKTSEIFLFSKVNKGREEMVKELEG